MFVNTNIDKKSIRQPGIRTIIDFEQIFSHLTGISCPNVVEVPTAQRVRTQRKAPCPAPFALPIESNGYWHLLSAICSIRAAVVANAARMPEVLID